MPAIGKVVNLAMRKNKSSNIDKYTTSDGYAYLTKRMVVATAKAAGRRAAKNAMEVMGYVVVSEGGWVVKKFKDGRVEKLSKLV
ncbi:hypothetical protein [Terrimonas ferruginea]|uniref:hypothetical protein n=1 Tax=Terrimonas ferruginea TaxID=249 RepID=UPI00048ECA6F|nr:hypothetical protein [Terrimonas ferruginea]